MIRVTSDGADKLIRQLKQQKIDLLKEMDELSAFVASVTEDKEAVRPVFDFNKTLAAIEEVDNKVIKIRHAKSVFNNNTIMSNGLTLGENLVKIGILEATKDRYRRLANNREFTRRASTNKDVEYTYINYNLEDAKKKYEEVYSELSELQQELNMINSSEKYMLEINI